MSVLRMEKCEGELLKRHFYSRFLQLSNYNDFSLTDFEKDGISLFGAFHVWFLTEVLTRKGF